MSNSIAWTEGFTVRAFGNQFTWCSGLLDFLRRGEERTDYWDRALRGWGVRVSHHGVTQANRSSCGRMAASLDETHAGKGQR